MNCWEHMKCDRQSGGSKVEELGVCPASTARVLNGLNNGLNGGRFCWAVSGTLCHGKVQGTSVDKHLTCLACDFYQSVEKQEGNDFVFIQFSEQAKRSCDN